MTVTIELKPELEKRLAQKAEEKGLPIEAYIEVFIESTFAGDLANGQTEKAFYETATKEEWLAEFHKWIDSQKEKNYPSISDEMLRREKIYEDRL
ncbi:MAG: hypothetical protein KIS76_10220 [Pyrinomonadaceae bacterium]|nr:hypothetical protein [Pyrinomonadaceae bacterium]